MPHNLYFSFFELVRWLVANVFPIIPDATVRPLVDAVGAMSIYLGSTLIAVLEIVLFVFGPIISLKLFALIISAIIVIETVPNLVLAIMGLIKRIPLVP